MLVARPGHPVVRLFRIFLLATVAIVFAACSMDEKFIFFPSAAIEATPQDYGLAYEDVYFKTADGVRLHGWFISHPDARATLLWFHGNGGSIRHRARGAMLLHDQLIANVFILDDSGYGRSEGVVSETGTYEDAQAALRYLRSRNDIEQQRIVFFGQSLGSAVAADLAGR